MSIKQGYSNEKAKYFKHLGVYIDRKLNRTTHIDRIKGKLAVVAGIFKKLQPVPDLRLTV